MITNPGFDPDLSFLPVMFSNDLRKLMWIEALELMDRAERLHKMFFQPMRSAADVVWEPPADVIEVDGGLAIFVALPGISADRLKVYMEPGSIIVAGHRHLPELNPQCHFQRLEIPYGNFLRRINLPENNYEIESNVLVDGCLQLKLRKSSAHRPNG